MNTLLSLGVLCAVVCVNRVIATIPAYDYVSCHVDTPVRDLPHNILWNQPLMSADICAVHCLGYRYFGTQWNRECFCGDDAGTHGTAPEAECDHVCRGHPDEMCGGFWRMSIYVYDDGTGSLDPHFMLTSPSSGEHFCFDYAGADNEEMELIQDDTSGISVTGKVFEVAQGVTYFSDINIRNEDAHITLDKHVILVNEVEISWSTADLYSENGVVVRPVNERDETMWVQLISNDFSMVVNRHYDDTIGYYLGFYVSQAIGLSSQSRGLIGQFIHHDFEHTQNGDDHFVTWSINGKDQTIPVVQRERFNPAAHGNIICWLYDSAEKDNVFISNSGDVNVGAI